MKILFCFAALLSAGLAGSQCNQPKYTAQTLPEKRLSFGDGGGFTGVETTYTLLENGQLFKFASKAPEPMEIACVKKKTAKKLFETAGALDLLNLDFMHPGNMYQFVEFQDRGQQRRVAWGDMNYPADPKIRELYDQLKQLVAEKK